MSTKVVSGVFSYEHVIKRVEATLQGDVVMFKVFAFCGYQDLRQSITLIPQTHPPMDLKICRGCESEISHRAAFAEAQGGLNVAGA
jgi:hypothetical protein